jgi:hypothetical protein
MGEKLTLDRLIEMHRAECSAHIYGKDCQTLACLKRNWLSPLGAPDAYEFVGCLSYQTVKFLENEKPPVEAK